MAFNGFRSWVAGETVTAQLMNAQVRDNGNVIKTPIDDDGKVRGLSGSYLANLDGSALLGLHKTLNSQYTPVGNVGTGEDDLMSYTLPANTLSADGQRVKITAWGTGANNANAKTIKLYFGGTLIGTALALATGAAQSWRIEATITRSGSSAQEIESTTSSTNSANTTNAQTARRSFSQTKDLTATQVIKVTGEATSTNDIEQRGMAVDYLP